MQFFPKIAFRQTRSVQDHNPHPANMKQGIEDLHRFLKNQQEKFRANYETLEDGQEYETLDPIQSTLEILLRNDLSQIPADQYRHLHGIFNSDSREKKSLILAYLLILDGGKKGFFENGRINPEKIATKLDHFLKQSQLDFSASDLLDRHVLSQVKQSRDGTIKFGHDISLSRDQLQQYKSLRGTRHTSKANGKLGYGNAHGLCAGLSIQFARHFKKQDKTGFFPFLKALGTEVISVASTKEGKKSLQSARAGTKARQAYELWRNSTELDLQNRFRDAELGQSSHYYLVDSIDSSTEHISNYLLNTDGKGMSPRLTSATIMLNTISHAMCMHIEKDQRTHQAKITFYDPNTPRGPLVKYIDLKSNPENIQNDILSVFEGSVYFSEQYQDDVMPFWIYPGNSTGNTPEMVQVLPDSTDLSQYDSETLGQFLLAAFQSKDWNLVESIIAFDSTSNEKIKIHTSSEIDNIFVYILSSTKSNKIELCEKLLQNHSLDEIQFFDEFRKHEGTTLSYILETPELYESKKLMLSLFQKEGFESHLDQLIPPAYSKTYRQLMQEKNNSFITAMLNKQMIGLQFQTALDSNDFKTLKEIFTDENAFFALDQNQIDQAIQKTITKVTETQESISPNLLELAGILFLHTDFENFAGDSTRFSLWIHVVEKMIQSSPVILENIEIISKIRQMIENPIFQSETQNNRTRFLEELLESLFDYNIHHSTISDLKRPFLLFSDVIAKFPSDLTAGFMSRIKAESTKEPAQTEAPPSVKFRRAQFKADMLRLLETSH